MTSNTAVFRTKPDVTSPPRKRLKSDYEHKHEHEHEHGLGFQRALDYGSGVAIAVNSLENCPKALNLPTPSMHHQVVSEDDIEGAPVMLPEMLVTYLSLQGQGQGQRHDLVDRLFDVRHRRIFHVQMRLSFAIFDIQRHCESVTISKYALQNAPADFDNDNDYDDDNNNNNHGSSTSRTPARKSITSIAIHYEIGLDGRWNPVLAKMLSCQQALTNTGSIGAFAQILARDLLWAYYNEGTVGKLEMYV